MADPRFYRNPFVADEIDKVRRGDLVGRDMFTGCLFLVSDKVPVGEVWIVAGGERVRPELPSASATFRQGMLQMSGTTDVVLKKPQIVGRITGCTE